MGKGSDRYSASAIRLRFRFRHACCNVCTARSNRNLAVMLW